MDEPILKKKQKFDLSFFKKNIYLVILGLVLILGTSFGLTFFIQNKKIGEVTISIGDITYTVTQDKSISINNLNMNVNDVEGLLGYSKEIIVRNTSDVNGKLELKINRTSGVPLEGLRYGLYINDVLVDISDMPSDGIIYHSAILGNEEIKAKVVLWLQDNYYVRDRTFVGDIEEKITLDSMTAGGYLNSLDNLNNNYVKFNGDETWRIKGIEDGRIIVTKTEDLNNTFTNSNLYNVSNTLTDSSLVTSMSTDNKAYYLKKTVKIIGGKGTASDPYILGNDIDDINDRKITGYITYNSGIFSEEAPATQPIYYDEVNYIGGAIANTYFEGWSTTSGEDPDYILGDTFTFKDSKTLYGSTSKNVMNTFPEEITNKKADITKIYFKNEAQNIIDSKCNNATGGVCKDITYNNLGIVKAWLDTDPNDNTKYIMYVESAGTTYFNTGSSLFSEYVSVTTIDFNNIDTSLVTDMSYMFNNCFSLTTLDVSNFDTSKVTNMEYMFAGDKERAMSLSTIIGLTSFKTYNVTNMARMFYMDCALTSLDLSSFDTYNVQSMAGMFSGDYYNTEIPMNLTNIYGLENFDTSSVTDMNGMFAHNFGLTTLDLSNFDTSNVTNMKWMFDHCTDNLISLDLSSFDTSKVTNMSFMFRKCSKLKTIYVSDLWNTDNVTDSSVMFEEDYLLVGGNGTVFDSNVVDKTYAKIDKLGMPGYLTKGRAVSGLTQYNVTNLLQYSSFENEGWSNCQYDSTEKYIGNYSCKINGVTTRIETSSRQIIRIQGYSSHVYYVSGFAKSTLGVVWEVFFPEIEGASSKDYLPANNWYRKSDVFTRSAYPDGEWDFRVDFNNSFREGTMWYDGMVLIDLTATFGAGNEPDLGWCNDHIYYFDGTGVFYK